VDQGVLAFRVDLLAQVSQHRFRVFQVDRVAQVWTFLEVRDGLVVLVCSSDKNIHDSCCFD